MKVLCVLGSPRTGGNSETLARAVAKPLAEAGADVTFVELNKLTYRGCQACRACKTTSDHCVLDDDLKPVLAAYRTADVIVMASPVYYGDLSGQMKCFFDRTFENLVPDYATADNPSRLLPGKQVVLAMTQAAPAEHFADVIPRYSAFFEWGGIERVHGLRAVEVHGRDDIAGHPETLAEAAAVAHRILGA